LGADLKSLQAAVELFNKKAATLRFQNKMTTFADPKSSQHCR
jgi:hypothetical protein